MEPGRRWDEEGSMGSGCPCAACSGGRLGRAEKLNWVKSSVRYDFYHLYHFHFSAFIYSYYSAYFIFLRLKLKSENSINGRNTLNPLRHNGFGYTIFKSENSMTSCQNVGKR